MYSCIIPLAKHDLCIQWTREHRHDGHNIYYTQVLQYATLSLFRKLRNMTKDNTLNREPSVKLCKTYTTDRS